MATARYFRGIGIGCALLWMLPGGLLLIPFPAGASVAPNDGEWTDATNSVASWMDKGKWRDGIVAYGPGRTATFELDHTVGKTVDLPVDITIGTIRYRDNGNVNRDMTFSSSNSSCLVMASTGGAPRIWARNRSIYLDVPIAGTNGLELLAEQAATGSVELERRNSYSGTTEVLDSGGVVRTSYPGDFGKSDVVVRGNLSDPSPELLIDHSRALAPAARLSIDPGALVELDFSSQFPDEADPSDLFVKTLVLGGTMLTNGIYSASNRPGYFSGTGEIVVQHSPRTVAMKGEFDLQTGVLLSWEGRRGTLYDIRESTNLPSAGWETLETVEASIPTNQYSLAMPESTAAYYRVVERADYHSIVRYGVVAELDRLIGEYYLAEQNTNSADIRCGQFHNSDNMRMSECTPVLAWAYGQPDSRFCQDGDVLEAAVRSIDYMCRAQGSNGGFNEYQGWCGVPGRTPGKSSVLGFTMHAIGSAVEQLAGLPEMAPRLDEYMDPNGTGTDDTVRRTAWMDMLSGAMTNLFSGTGRGHAPNQDLCALRGIYAINQAYFALSGGTLLKTQSEIDSLANEIYYGHPSAAASRPDGKWFSSTGMLGEEGHGWFGYDGNYGVNVSLRYLGVLAPLDTTSASFVSGKYAGALQYFFVPDPAAALGVYAENGISRRNPGKPLEPSMASIGNVHGRHAALERLYDIMLPYFASAPAANMVFPSPHQFQIGVWAYCEWMDNFTTPTNTDCRLPAEQEAGWEFRDDAFNLLVAKPADGTPVYYTETWDATNLARRHIVGQAPETIDSLDEFP